jgi:HSP20 family protein
MSLFPEFDMFRRNIGDLFNDFERTFIPHHHSSLYPLMTDLSAAPLLLGTGDTGMGTGEESKEGDTQLATQGSGNTALSPFQLRAPVQIRLDVNETDKEININAELAGMDKNDIKLSVRDKVLTIEGEKKQEKKVEDKNHRILRSERVYGMASRSLRLPKYADDSKLKAKYDNGVLRIVIPKAPEEKKPEQTIQIE